MLALRKSSNSRVVAFIVVLAMILMYTFAFGGVVFAADKTVGTNSVIVHGTESGYVQVFAEQYDLEYYTGKIQSTGGSSQYSGMFYVDIDDLATAKQLTNELTIDDVEVLWSGTEDGEYLKVTIRKIGVKANGTVNIWLDGVETLPEVDIEVEKMVENLTDETDPGVTVAAIVGDAVKFIVTATNNGPDLATGVAITDAVPSGLTGASVVASADTSYDEETDIWTIGDLASGASATLTMTGTVDEAAGMKITNTATVSSVAQTDSNSSNNSAEAEVVIERDQEPEGFDIEVLKSVDDSTATVGQTITFTVTVENHGPEIAENVTIYDPVNLPGLTGVVVNQPTHGQVTIGGIWLVGTLDVEETATMTVTATIAAGTAVGTVITNVATVQYEGDFKDLDSDNNSASAAVTVVSSGGGGGGGGGGGTTTTVIPPEPTPLAPIPTPEPEVVIVPDPVPLADVPQTGINDNAILYAGMLLVSLAGITALARRKKSVSE